MNPELVAVISISSILISVFSIILNSRISRREREMMEEARRRAKRDSEANSMIRKAIL